MLNKSIIVRAALDLVCVILTVRTAAADVSPSIVVDSAQQSAHWSILFTNATPLMWTWPAEATHACLSITGMNSTFSTNFTNVTSNFLWQAFTSDVPSKEDVAELSLTFYNDCETVGTLNARLAILTGVFGDTAVNASADRSAWTKINDNAVVPYCAAYANVTTDVATAQLVIAKAGGMTQTNVFATADGYYGWILRNSDWRYGTFALSLAFPGTDADALTAELFRPLDGTLVRVR